MTWQVSSQGPAVFRVGELAIPCYTEHAALANPINVVETARLLCLIHYENQHVLSKFHQMPKVVPKHTDMSIDVQIRYLRSESPLVDALKRLGLHQHDDDGRYADELGRSVGDLAAGFHTASDEDIGDFVGRSTLHAQKLVGILSADFKESARDILAVHKFA
ncbi:hypothetical protein [Pandoraea oxalativorans]|uniref:hypothetical protein n=1 Tax=Pandoraea oxalativorans TaxID=573737 RepID=UPI0006983761|nr:hypothetical protein [Pandoraea oxalativorans]